MKPIFIENSRVPLILSYLTPISWFNWLQGKSKFEIGAVTLPPFIFSRGEMGDRLKNHESIHVYQGNDLFIIGAVIIYAWDYIHGLIKYRNDYDGYDSVGEKAYYRTRAEQEAYGNEKNLQYLEHRVKYEWLFKYKV